MPASPLDRYTIDSELGRGAMGVVYLAHDQKIDRQVALKELLLVENLTPAVRQELMDRFDREARAAGRLNHPNIVGVYDVFTDRERSFIVMEYLDGETLADILERGPLDADSAAAVTLQVLNAVAHAHANQVIHRDLKPDNVFILKDGAVKVTDFGIAHIGDPSASLTRAGTILGTVGYMSPEQLRGEPIDERSDIFAIGVMLYEMLGGLNPFGTDAPTAVMYRIAYEEPQPVRSLRQGVPKYLDAVIRKAIHKEREQRYQSAAAMAIDLVQHKGPKVRPATLNPPPLVTEAAAQQAKAARSAPTVIGAAPPELGEQSRSAKAAPTVIGVAPLDEPAPAAKSAPTVIGVETVGPEAVGAGAPEARVVDGSAPAEPSPPALETPAAAGVGPVVKRARLRTAALIAAVVVVVVALIVTAIVVFTGSNAPKARTPGTAPSAVLDPQVLQGQAKRLDSIGSNIGAAAVSYSNIIADLQRAAKKNASELKSWHHKWQGLETAYQKALTHDRANPGTPGYSYSATVTVRNPNGSFAFKTVTRWHPGTPGSHTAVQPRNTFAVSVHLGNQYQKLTGLAARFNQLAHKLSATRAAAPFAQTVADAKAAIKLVQKKLKAMRRATSKGLISKDHYGNQVLAAKTLKLLDTAGVAASLQKIRDDLKAAVKSASLETSILSWATKQ